MGLSDRPIENYRRSRIGEKAWRDFPLESRLNAEADIRRGIDLRAAVGSEKIEIPPNRVVGTSGDVKWLEARVTHPRAARPLTMISRG